MIIFINVIIVTITIYYCIFIVMSIFCHHYHDSYHIPIITCICTYIYTHTSPCVCIYIYYTYVCRCVYLQKNVVTIHTIHYC
jgi:hypothetical protein